MTDQQQVRQGISLYRFEPDDCKRLIQLQENKIFISNPNNFNDPLDLRLSLDDRTFNSFDEYNFKKLVKFIYDEKLIDDFYILDDDIKRKISDWHQELDYFLGLKDLADLIKKRILSFGVQCFSLDFNIPLQWSHYSKAHKGFCIEYNFRPIDLVSNKQNNFAYYHVSYTNKLPKVCISEVLLTPRQAMEKLLATKTLEWTYEQEIRIVHFEKQGQLIDMPQGLSIKSLTAGENMCEGHLNLLKKVGEKLNVPVYQMKRNYRDEFESLWSRKEL
ncbi:DUF2971 domain-containing protein [Acinetobacter baumannii]|uniref:DUF2971 domain-containing protein n=1 Tax=Acinetobacter calcoaceticus/baumannii complex TaxID=909768 RepID=UPI0005A5DE37|nr:MULTISPECIES: DUF2971 domain-containing protein [Acinetobacter calcoaceticus/baumannii complex]MDI7719930.1 DUF2971 domain-containing protein [Acinetobacter baumannii]